MAETTAAPEVQAAGPPVVPRAGRNEWLLLTFTGSTVTADAVTRVVLPLVAVQLTSSPILISLVAVLLTLPWLVTALHVGVFVDRKNRRSLMVGAEAARMVSIGVLLLAYLIGQLNLPVIYVVSVVLGVAEVVAVTAGASILPAAIPRSRWQTAVARITAVEYLSSGFVGAPIGGFLVAAGVGNALGATTGIYVAGALLLVLLVGNFNVEPTKERRPMHEEIRDGVGFLWRNTLLRTMALLIAALTGSWVAWIAILPGYAVTGPLHLTERDYGFLLTCLGAGGITGTVVVGPVNRWLGRRWSMFACVIGTTAMVAVPALMPARPSSAFAVGAAAFAAGLGGTMWTVNSRVIYQTLVPSDMLGRFSAASRLVGWGCAPIAGAISGVLATTFGYRTAFGAFAVLCAAMTVPFLRVVTAKAVGVVDQPTEEPATEEPATAGQ